jgi:hypothetical protein
VENKKQRTKNKQPQKADSKDKPIKKSKTENNK